MKRTILLALSLLLGILTFAQNTITVKGVVLDKKTKDPLVGALLLHPSTKLGAVSGVDGSFRLVLPDSIKYLEISYLGYLSQTLEFTCEDCEYEILLDIDAMTSDEIVIPFDYLNLDEPHFSAVHHIPISLQTTQNGINILPLFNKIAGVYVHSGALNTNRITVRGVGARSPFSTRSIKMYYNEIPITSVDGGSVMEDLDMSSFDKVYLIKGPTGTTLGSPLGGAMVLDNYEWYPKSSFNSNFTMGSFGLWRMTNRFQFREQKMAIQAFQNTTQSDGFRANNQYDRKSVGVNGKFRLNNKNTMSFIWHYIQLTAQIPSSLDSATFENAPESAAGNWLATQGYEDYNRFILGANHEFLGKITDKIQLKATNSLFVNRRSAYEVRPFNILNEDMNNFGMRSIFTLSNTTSEKKLNWNFKIGQEFVLENYTWQTFENEDNGTQGDLLADNLEDRQYINLFSELNLSISNYLNLSFGLNSNQTQYELTDRFDADNIDQSGSKKYDRVWSPKLGVNYTFTRFYLIKMQAYASISHGYSMPSVEETLLPDGLINLDLKPESGWNFEIGTEGNLFDNRIIYDFSIYRMLIDNLIVAERIDADSYVGINAGQTQHDGLELSLQYEHRFIDGSFRIKSSYALNNFVFNEFIDDGEDHSGNALTGVPTSTMNIDFNINGNQKYPFYAAIQYQFIDAMPIYDDNSLFTESYQLLNTKVGYEWKWKNVELNVYLGYNNLFNEKYASMIAVNALTFGNRPPRLYYPGMPRNIFGGIAFNILL